MKISPDLKIIIGVVIVTTIIVVVAAFTIGNQPAKEPGQPEQKVLSQDQLKILLPSDTHMTGPKQAKVIVVEFGDFQCPACGVAYQVVKQIKEQYKGKINFAFREFPLMAHKYGYAGALAAEAASGQGKFWEMYDKLYSNQKEWSESKDALTIFASYAKEIGIDADKFKKDVESKKYDAKIQADLRDGNQLGINATPTFFINGKMYTGALTYDNFKSAVENDLKNK